LRGDGEILELRAALEELDVEILVQPQTVVVLHRQRRQPEGLHGRDRRALAPRVQAALHHLARGVAGSVDVERARLDHDQNPARRPPASLNSSSKNIPAFAMESAPARVSAAVRLASASKLVRSLALSRASSKLTTPSFTSSASD